MSARAALLFSLALLASAPSASAKQPLGRLFFTPEERQALNQRRNAPPRARVDPMPQPDSPEGVEPAPQPQSVMLDPPRITGFVRRSSGNDTVWVDEQPNFVRRRGSP